MEFEDNYRKVYFFRIYNEIIKKKLEREQQYLIVVEKGAEAELVLSALQSLCAVAAAFRSPNKQMPSACKTTFAKLALFLDRF